MDKRYKKRFLDLEYAKELYYYDIYPKVVPVGKETAITLEPLGRSFAFVPEETYTVRVCPMGEGMPNEYPFRRNRFAYSVKPDTDGCLRVPFLFFAEQEYYFRIYTSLTPWNHCHSGEPDWPKRLPAEQERMLFELPVYAVEADLQGLYPFKGDTHLHSSDSHGSEPPELVAAYNRKSGLDFVVISEHYRYYPSLDAMDAFRDCPTEMCIVLGEEVHSPKGPDGNSNDLHYVAFGNLWSIDALFGCNNAEMNHWRGVPGTEGRAVCAGETPPEPMPPISTPDEHIAYMTEYAKQFNLPEGVDRYPYAESVWIADMIHKAGGAAVFAHPYWIQDVLQVPPPLTQHILETAGFDALEVFGGAEYYEQNGFQLSQYYQDKGNGLTYAPVGGSDQHRSVGPDMHRIATILFAEANTRAALVEAIRNGKSIAVDYLNPDPLYCGDFRLVRYALFLEKNYFTLHDELCFEEGRAMVDFALGKPGAKEILQLLCGRVQKQREKYFAV
ncbi:MAG: hypothetical protein LBR73_06160 [Oscillospiraceae bacterium]|jgi:predicted metal-dependent phosphoesterase TrpH|nr:hypothetical protein [Oscillospiraceae bacterium]